MPRPAAVAELVEDVTDPEPARRMVTIDYEGHDYSLDLDLITIEALEAFEDQKYMRAIRLLLDAEQWAVYKTRHPFAVDLDRFVGALVGALGNSSASPAS